MIREILIISESSDISTPNVMDWLHFYGKKVVRKNVDADYENFNLKINNDAVTTSLKDFVVWNRRGYLPLIPIELKKTVWIDYLKKEQLSVLFSIESFNKENYIGSYNQEFNNNKLLILESAVDSGLKIPNTIVTNNKKDLLGFIEEGKRYITKSLYKSPYVETYNFVYYGNGTIEIDGSNLSENFAPSLVQEYIEKEIEIRVFFIEDFFYSMAIFSQNNEKTMIDFRNYDTKKPNRNIPFTLNDETLEKLKVFKNKIEYSTGSIDLILTPQGEYVFLEINAMGQYSWLSESCNYYIDKKIAEILIHKAND